MFKKSNLPFYSIQIINANFIALLIVMIPIMIIKIRSNRCYDNRARFYKLSNNTTECVDIITTFDHETFNTWSLPKNETCDQLYQQRPSCFCGDKYMNCDLIDERYIPTGRIEVIISLSVFLVVNIIAFFVCYHVIHKSKKCEPSEQTV